MNCFEKYEKIKEYEYWTVYLHTNQCYIGRCVIALKKHKEDFFEISDAELKELFKIVNHLKKSIEEIFRADKFNYASLGNEIPHLHIHFVPRYKKKVFFRGIKFEDKNWGHNFYPYDKEFAIPKEVFLSLRDAIKEKL